jgi:hypothetical protein
VPKIAPEKQKKLKKTFSYTIIKKTGVKKRKTEVEKQARKKTNTCFCWFFLIHLFQLPITELKKNLSDTEDEISRSIMKKW